MCINWQSIKNKGQYMYNKRIQNEIEKSAGSHFNSFWHAPQISFLGLHATEHNGSKDDAARTNGRAKRTGWDSWDS